MWVKTDDFDKQLKKLQRVVQPALFRYVIIQYNHADIKKEIIQFLQANFSDRTLLSIKIRETDYFQLLAKTDALEDGFVVIEDYEYLINDEAFAMGFNQRRDRLSAKNIAYICLIPNDDKLLKKCRELIPDWWSFRSMLLKFEVKFLSNTDENKAFKSLEISSLGGLDFAAKKDELDWLEEKIQSLPDTEINLKLELLQKATDIANNLQLVDKLFLFIESMNLLAEQVNLAIINPLQFAKIQNTTGKYFILKTDFKQAKNHFQIALNIALKANYDIDITAYQNNLATVYQYLGENLKAKELLEKVVLSTEKHYGNDNPNTALRYSNLASVLKDMGDYEEAKTLSERVLHTFKKHLGIEHPFTTVAYSNLATVLQNLGDYIGAKELMEKALLLDLKNFGEGHSITNIRYSNLALVYKDMGDYEKAEEMLVKALTSDIENFGHEHPNSALRKWNLATVLIASGFLDKALILIEQAYTTYKNILGPEHHLTENCKGWLDDLRVKMLESKH